MKHMYRLICISFLVAFLVLGACMTFLNPPFNIPDENRHWLFVHIGMDQWLGRPPDYCSLYKALPEFFEIHRTRWKAEERAAVGKYRDLDNIEPACHSESRVLYGTLLGYPGTVAARLAMTPFQDNAFNAVTVFFVSRLFQGLIIFFLLWRLVVLAFKGDALPAGAAVTTALCLSPLFIQQSFAVTSDVVCNAFAVCLAAWLIAWPRVEKLDLGLFIVTGLLMSSTKPVYLPAAMFAILARTGLDLWTDSGSGPGVGAAVLKTRAFWTSNHGLAIIAFIPMILLALWQTLGFFAMKETLTEMSATFNRGDQLSVFLSNPWVSLKAIFGENLAYYRFDRLAGPLGWLDTEVGIRSVRTWRLLFILAVLADLAAIFINRKPNLNREAVLGYFKWAGQWGLAGLATATGILISGMGLGFSLLLGSTQVGSVQVHGFQARYFFFFLLPVLAMGFKILQAGDLTAPVEWAGKRATFLFRGVYGGLLALILVLLPMLAWLYFYDLSRRYW